jgi:hypothetical protein
MSDAILSIFDSPLKHKLVVTAGADPNHVLGMPVAIKSGEDFYAGAVGHINSSGEFVEGPSMNSADQLAVVPVWAKNNSADPSVIVATTGAYSTNAGGGKVNIIVGMAGIEISTTEFVDETYAPLDKLVMAGSTDKGKVRKFTGDDAGTDDVQVIGYVSPKGERSEQGVPVLYILPFVGTVESAG